MRRRTSNKRQLGGNVLSNLTGIVDKFFTGQEFPGERHAVSLSGKDKGKVMQYTGPQTNLDVRLARGDPGINDLDRAAKEHDIAYRDQLTRYRQTGNKKDMMRNVWEADDRFVSKAFNSKDDPLTGKVAGSLIKAKELAEKAGLLPTEVFSGAGKGYNRESDPLKKLRMAYEDDTGCSKRRSNSPRSPRRSSRRSKSPRKSPRRSRSPKHSDFPVNEEYDEEYPEEYSQHGGIPIGPIISVLATVGPPIIEYVWNKIHGTKGSGQRGRGSNLSIEDKRHILLQQLTGDLTI